MYKSITSCILIITSINTGYSDAVAQSITENKVYEPHWRVENAFGGALSHTIIKTWDYFRIGFREMNENIELVATGICYDRS